MSTKSAAQQKCRIEIGIINTQKYPSKLITVTDCMEVSIMVNIVYAANNLLLNTNSITFRKRLCKYPVSAVSADMLARHSIFGAYCIGGSEST